MTKKKEPPEPHPPTDTMPPVKFYLVVLHPDGDLNRETHDTLGEITERIAALVNHDVSVFAFSGHQLQISKPPFRHLLTPWGPQPLFAIDDHALEPDDTGYLGVDAIHLASPPEIHIPSEHKPISGKADEFFDSGGDAAGFDNFDFALPDPDS